jgi:hypothetical protein
MPRYVLQVLTDWFQSKNMRCFTFMYITVKIPTSFKHRVIKIVCQTFRPVYVRPGDRGLIPDRGHRVKSGFGVHPASVQCVPGVLSLVKHGWGLTLTTHLI